jgi:hypothetical protein
MKAKILCYKNEEKKSNVRLVRRVAAFTQKINCLHIISAKKIFFACTKKYYF